MTPAELERLTGELRTLAGIVSCLQVQLNDIQQQLDWLRDCTFGEVPF